MESDRIWPHFSFLQTRPARTHENSPAIYRWVTSQGGKVPLRDRRRIGATCTFFRPCGTYHFGHVHPSVETLGYFHASLRDCQRLRCVHRIFEFLTELRLVTEKTREWRS